VTADIALEPGMPFTVLRQDPRWVGWRWEKDKRAGKRTKVPYAPGSGRLARSNDPSTWGSWVDARAMRGVDGVGYNLFGRAGLAALDEDACRDAASGVLLPWADNDVKRCATHTEITPSGTGVRPVGIARVAAPLDFQIPRGPNGQKVEVYAGGPARYICVTDNTLLDRPLADLTPIIEELQAERQARAKGSAGSSSPEDWAAVLATLSEELAELIRDGAPAGTDRSRSLFQVIASLRRLGFTEARIIGLLRAYPAGISARCLERGRDDLARQVRLALPKIDDEIAAPRADLAHVLPTQEKLAAVFAARHAGIIRFVPERQQWHRWHGSHWLEDRSDYALHLARQICRERGRILEKGPGRLDDYRFVRAVEQFARSDRDLVVEAGRWNRDGFLFATPGGTVVLTTGEVRDARPEDFISRCARVTPAPVGTPATLWLKFLAEITQGNEELARFLQQWFGYSLTGDTREQALVFCYGPGGNGKSVLLNVLMRIVGSYGAVATMDAFLDSQASRHSTEVAMLDGARLVAASEIDPGRYWAESRVKALTGGDPVTARYMRENNFTFIPVLKLTLIGNRKPSLHKVDDAARRRFNIVPLLYRPEQVDRQLETKLMAEAPEILRWLLDGCLDWQRHGLVRPAVVTAATGVYFEEQDTFDDWVAESCDLDPGNQYKSEAASALFSSWAAYAKAAGAHPGNKSDFGDRLIDLGCERHKGAKGVRTYRGIRLNPLQQSERSP
jgi:putative DNA primase/helicase